MTASPKESAAVRRRIPAKTGRTGLPVRLLEGRALEGSEPAGAALVVSCGYAGAVQPELRTGDLVADARGLELELVEALRDSAAEAGLRLSFGLIGHAENGRPPEGARLAAVDADTQAVREWSKSRSVPCLALRSVLDELGHETRRRLPFDAWRRSARAGDRLSRGLAALLERL